MKQKKKRMDAIGLEKDDVQKDRRIKKHIVHLVRFSEEKYSQRDLVKQISREVPADKTTVNKILSGLIENNTLMYAGRFGRTFVELSANKPRRISRRITLCPYTADPGKDEPISPGLKSTAKNGEITVMLTNGTAFGYGGHPTTRIALRALDHYVTHYFKPRSGEEQTILDVGIGSGVLSVTALKMGLDKAVGTDIDPMAVHESMENARINNQENKLTVKTGTLARGPFNLILANLRTPGILRHVHDFRSLLTPNSHMVVSGILRDEFKTFESTYIDAGYSFLRRFTERRWVGLLVRRDGDKTE